MVGESTIRMPWYPGARHVPDEQSADLSGPPSYMFALLKDRPRIQELSHYKPQDVAKPTPLDE